MIIRTLEIRDRATCIQALAIRLNTPCNSNSVPADTLLRLAGYGPKTEYTILIPINGGVRRASDDPYSWGGRTLPEAHRYIHDQFHELEDGDVVDVEFILGETTTCKRAEWLDHVKET